MRSLYCLILAAGICLGAAAQAQPQAPSTEREQLALAALEGLMAAPAERALPLLQRTLASDHSLAVKQRALFVLSQVDDPAAQQILLQTARSGEAGLREEAIRSIGIGGDAAALAALREIYGGADEPLRRAILEAWMIAERVDKIASVARDDNDPVAEDAIHLLGALGAQVQLRELARSGRGGSSLVHALALAEDLDALLEIVNGNAAMEQREEAVRAIGIVDTPQAVSALQQTYLQSSEPRLREAALQGLLVADAETEVLALYRQSSDPARKRELLRTLSLMGGDAALEAIDAALRGEL